MSGNKYYAVKEGREPGIYNSWSQAEKQVTHYSNNNHKSFDTPEAAREWSQGPGLHGVSGDKVYGVREGHQPGVYSSWPEAQQQVSHYPGNEHQSFKSHRAAESYVRGASQGSSGKYYK